MKAIWIKNTAVALSAMVAVAANAQIACPTSPTGPNFTKFRDAAIEKINGGLYSEVSESFKACFPATVPKCLEATSTYTEEKLTGSIKPVPPTPMMLNSEKDLPSEFWAKDAEGNIIPGQVQIPKDIFELAKTRGWKVLDYKTRSSGGFDSSPNLVMIVLPNHPKPNQDVFLQISPAADADHPSNGADPKPNPRSTNGLDVLTVITSDKTLNPPVGQLRLFQGDNRSNPEKDALYPWNNDLRSNSCTRCHTVPLRAISPRGYGFINWEKPMSPEDQALTKEINDLMHVQNFSWGADSQGQPLGVRPDSQPYGWSPAPRKDDFIKNCFEQRPSPHDYFGFNGYTVRTEKSISAELSAGSIQKIKNAMNCVSCHDGKIRGSLHKGFSFKEIEFKVLIDRSMPPAASLGTDERLTLLQCLKEEYNANKEAWEKSGAWMKKVQCGPI